MSESDEPLEEVEWRGDSAEKHHQWLHVERLKAIAFIQRRGLWIDYLKETGELEAP